MNCKKESNLQANNQVTSIQIEIFNPNPLLVDLNSYKPNLKGKISSDYPLSSYAIYLFNSGNKIKVYEKQFSTELPEYEFDVNLSYQLSTESLSVEATNAEGKTGSISISLDVKQLEDVEPVAISNHDAFPGAEGYGRYTTGGRGGKILFVDNLSDDGKQGSLRWAINQTGARTIVFRVSGTIELVSPLIVFSGNLTIAGQSAPGDGICIAKNYLNFQDNLQNVIIRYVRFRNAHGSSEYDAAWGRNCKNIIFDHCSFSWGNDEVASFYDNTDFTMQWCMITESFYHSTHPKGDHGYGGIWGGMGASFHHNLIAHHTSRNPRFCGARYHTATRDLEIVDFRNNVIYNWGFNSVYGGEYGQQNMVNNYYKSGLATQTDKKNRIVEITDADSKWYIDGNYVEDYPSITSDNWAGGVQGASSSPSVKAATPFPFGEIVTETAEAAYAKVLELAGASLVRDVIDTRIVNEVSSGTATYGGIYGDQLGIIDSESDVGGFPELKTYNQMADYDDDGMPDEWEIQHGLDPKNSQDHSGFDLSTSYTNIEVYLNGLASKK